MSRPSWPIVAIVALAGLVALVVLAAALVLLGGSDDSVADDPELEARVAAADPAEGEGVYTDLCAACHGPEGGGGIGPSLHGVAGSLTVSEMHHLVTAGKGRMPAWSGTLEPSEIDAVVAYVRQAF